ncbi:hypothetical protein CYMTET_14582 [Cymbomonas tetramitiformis]|uniref:1-alkyl-2-acetylglycerophosphocholine esterase n=1 Tax=Cymbomonas tetramitiformis TaxID=36881 RepID=A0AAE0GG37_9CHLO|nr:hypothetical protein CYMTET_14582 [Cymbomonas tetramitiformis]
MKTLSWVCPAQYNNLSLSRSSLQAKDRLCRSRLTATYRRPSQPLGVHTGRTAPSIRANVSTDTLAPVAQLGRRVLVGGTTFVVGFRGIASLVVAGLPQPPPLPKGGFTDEVGVYETRIGEDVNLPLRTRIFYPSQDSSSANAIAVNERSLTRSDATVAPYFPAGAAVSEGIASLVSFPRFLLAHLATASSGCVHNAAPLPPPTSSPSAKLPVIVYSHGFGGNADMACYAMRRMAASGMVVVALEHQDGSASHATDHLGNPIKFDGGSLGLQRRSQEVLTVGASIKTGKAMASGEIAEELSRIMDTDNVFVGGHSYGCPTALLACQASKDLFRGAVLHDPAITADSMASQGGCPVPAVYLLGDGYAGNARIRAGVAKALSGSAPNSSAWHILGAEHGNFVDAPMWAPLWVMRNIPFIPAAGAADPVQVHDVLGTSSQAFMSQRFKALETLPLMKNLGSA